MDLLMAAGVDVEARADNGWRAAMFATSHGREGWLGWLIAEGEDIEATNNEGWTAAMLAASHGHPGLASLIEGILLSRREAAELELSSASPEVGAGRGGARV